MLTDDLKLQVPTKICTFNQGQCHGHCLPQVNPRVTWCPPASPPGSGRNAARTRAWKHKLQTSKVCLVTQKNKQWGSFISGMMYLESAGKKLLVMPFFHLAIPKSGDKLLECSFAGLPRLIALLFVRLGAADLRKKTGSTFSSSFYVWYWCSSACLRYPGKKKR